MVHTIPAETPYEAEYYTCPSCAGATLVGDEVLRAGRVICGRCAEESLAARVEREWNQARKMERYYADLGTALGEVLNQMQREDDEAMGSTLAQRFDRR